MIFLIFILGLIMLYMISSGLFWFAVFIGATMVWIFFNKEDPGENNEQ